VDDSDPVALERQLAYYRRRVDELGGENVKLDITLSEMRHSLRQKQAAFALLSELQQSIGSLSEMAPIFELTVHAINRVGGMDKAVVLVPAEAKHSYRVVHAAGVHEDTLTALRSKTFRFPDEFAARDGLVLVTKSSPPTPLTRDISQALDLPYFVCVPVEVEDLAVGLLLAGRAKEARPLYPPLDDGDVDTFRAVAGLITANVHNQRLVRRQEAEASMRQRFEHELEVARLIQQNYLPQRLPELPGWQLAAYYSPAREVGGDFYDVIALPDGCVGLVVGDVTDKGVPAALVMSATRSVLRVFALRGMEPGAVLASVNDHLCPEIPERMFVTCLYGVLDPASGVFRFANAGHDVPYVKTADGVVELRARGMPLGLMPGMEYEQKETVLQPGDGVLLHSDGVVEAHGPGRMMFGFPRLKETVARGPKGQALIDCVLTELGAFTGAGAEQEDDITLLTLVRAAAGMPTASGSDGTVLAEFDLESRPGNERQAIERVAEAVAGVGLDPRRLARLQTAVGEAAMNAMEHGNRYRADLPVTIRVAEAVGQLRVQVTDQGGVSELPTAVAPDLRAKLDGDEVPRGWGRFLIENLVDETIVTTDGALRTVELVMHIEGDDHGDP
jgi:serine phosphatase RsbU (regulator of sigma subunit)/anti-sigma regulatory factor (Ser/Thr protein kinase)